MKIVFFGTSPFSAAILESVVQMVHEVLAIVTRPDRPRGRDLKLMSSPVKAFAQKVFPNIPIFQPEKASTDAFCEELKVVAPELFLVVAYGEIIKKNLLSVPSKACVNIHTSLLPEYRGAAPIQRCIMDGKAFSGVTFMEMALKMDAGDILKQEIVPIPLEMTGVELEQALLAKAKETLPELLSNFDFYYSNKQAQDETKTTFAAKISPDDSIINWEEDGETIYNQIRALSPSPGVFIRLRFGEEVKRLKVLSSKFHLDVVEKTGQLSVDRSTMKISCKNGFLEPLLVQLEGKRAMKIEEFLRGVSKCFSLVI